MTRVLAVDVGGTKFAAAVIDADGEVHARAEEPIAGDDPVAVLRRVVTATGPRHVDAAAIGSAGPLDRERGTVSPVNIPAWRDFPLAATVARWLPAVPLSLAGDAQCMALGEWWRGGRPGSLLGVVVSTGIGGGLVLDGRPHLGPTGNAGHIGHITVDPRGQACPCGAVGCVETFASGPAMVRWARGRGWSGPDARALATAAGAGDPVAREAFDRGAEALATGLLTTAALCDVDRVVVGGGVAEAGDVLFDPLRRALQARRGMAFLRRLRVGPAALGRDAGLFGAAALALHGVPAPLAGRAGVPGR
ncbi:ROK family protein [Dactylosporangium sp. CA-052675]|uniref:ROK family protein n=1 Tax=Dactylosporangium sp. CA-052675 TaxID=3239927 RepID=UPI003D8F7A6A